MRAAEYVTLWREWQAHPPLRSVVFQEVPPEEDGPCDKLDLVIELVRRVAQEIHEIAKARQAKSPEALGAIMRELQEKWGAIVRRLDDPLVTVEVFSFVTDRLIREEQRDRQASLRRK